MKTAASALATTLLASMALLVWTPAGPTAAQVGIPSSSGRTGSTSPPQTFGPFPNTPNPAWGPAYANPLAGNAEADELYESEVEAAREAQSLTEELQQASSDEDREGIRERLREALLRQFDAQQARRRLEIESIEERLAKYKEKVDRREAAKDMIVDRRLDQLTGVGDDLGWEETGGPHAGPGGPGPQYPPTLVPRPPQAAPGLALPPSGTPGASEPPSSTFPGPQGPDPSLF